MIKKGYHHVIDLDIACNFYISIDPVYPRCCARRSIAEGKLRGIWVLPSLQILQSIIHDEFWQGIIETTSIKYLFLPSFSILSIAQLKSPNIYFFFHFPHFYFPYNFAVIQRKAPQSTVPWYYALTEHKHREL